MPDDLLTLLGVSPKKIAAFRKKWKIAGMTVFGSMLRGDNRPDSDVDFLITFDPDAKWSLLDYVRMEEEMAALLGRSVDMIERRAVENSKNYLRKQHILEHPASVPQLDEHILLDVLIAARDALRFLDGSSREEFAGNELLQSALLRNLSMIGWGTRKLSQEFKGAHPEVDRQTLVHLPPGGWVFRHTTEDKLWQTVTVDLPALIASIELLVPPDEGD